MLWYRKTSRSQPNIPLSSDRNYSFDLLILKLAALANCYFLGIFILGNKNHEKNKASASSPFTPFYSPFQLIEGISFSSCADKHSLDVQKVMEQIAQKNHFKCEQTYM